MYYFTATLLLRCLVFVGSQVLSDLTYMNLAMNNIRGPIPTGYNLGRESGDKRPILWLNQIQFPLPLVTKDTPNFD
jgi:hypothetical protein